MCPWPKLSPLGSALLCWYLLPSPQSLLAFILALAAPRLLTQFVNFLLDASIGLSMSPPPLGTSALLQWPAFPTWWMASLCQPGGSLGVSFGPSIQEVTGSCVVCLPSPLILQQFHSSQFTRTLSCLVTRSLPPVALEDLTCCQKLISQNIAPVYPSSP